MKNDNLKILFVCTGNYFRSKFCEIVLSHYAKLNEIENVEISSSGIDITYEGNIGQTSPYTVQFATEKNYALQSSPKQHISEFDLQSFDIIYVMNIHEHYNYINENYSAFLHKCLFLEFNDIYDQNPYEILQEILDWMKVEFIDIIHE